MSTTAPDPTLELDDVTFLDTEDVHLDCCQHPDKFLCGAAFHPELKYQGADDDVCPDCLAVFEKNLCVNRHFHCPLNQDRPCPTADRLLSMR